MANGDAAALEGFTPVAGSEDIRLGYDAINRLADWIAGRTKNRKRSATGTAAMTTTGSSAPYQGSVDITFPVGLFSVRPKIALGIGSIATVNQQAGWGNATKDGFTLYYTRADNFANATAVSVDWTATEA